MKTLDEVIFEAPYSPTPWEADALHYLKEYRDECNNIINVHDDYIRLRNEMVEELNKMNPPLTWDELKGMEGKPVWVECKYFFCPQWVILTNVYDEKAMFIGDRIVDSELKEEMGDVWQAYRKERQ